MLSILAAALLAGGFGESLNSTIPGAGVSVSFPLVLTSGSSLSCPLCVALLGGSTITDGSSGHRIVYTSAEPDGATAIAHAFDTTGSFGTAGAVLAGWYVHGSLETHFDANGKLIFDAGSGFAGGAGSFGDIKFPGGSILGGGSEHDNILLFSNAAGSSGNIAVAQDTQNVLPSSAFLHKWFNNGTLELSLDGAGDLTATGAVTGNFLNMTTGLNFNGTTMMNHTSLTLAKQGLDTCASGIEDTIEFDSSAGASSGHATRMCLCRSNGSGTYAWQNLAGTSLTDIGTSTTCPD